MILTRISVYSEYIAYIQCRANRRAHNMDFYFSWDIFLLSLSLVRALRAARAHSKICKYAFAAIESRGTKGAPEYLRNPTRGSNAHDLYERCFAHRPREWLAFSWLPDVAEDAAREDEEDPALSRGNTKGRGEEGQLNAAPIFVSFSRDSAPRN